MDGMSPPIADRQFFRTIPVRPATMQNDSRLAPLAPQCRKLYRCFVVAVDMHPVDVGSYWLAERLITRIDPALRSPASPQYHSIFFFSMICGNEAISTSLTAPRAKKDATSFGSACPSVSITPYTRATGPNGQRISSGRTPSFGQRRNRSRQSRARRHFRGQVSTEW